jgi:hypothetical protein
MGGSFNLDWEFWKPRRLPLGGAKVPDLPW